MCGGLINSALSIFGPKDPGTTPTAITQDVSHESSAEVKLDTEEVAPAPLKRGSGKVKLSGKQKREGSGLPGLGL